MTCPFYGKHDSRLAGLISSHGNQCAVVHTRFSPCRMEMAGLPVEWGSCCLRRVPMRPPWNMVEARGGLAHCAACGDIDWYTDAQEGLCHDCLHRAELLALEAAGQGRLML
jgi:hypothetical protein